MSYDTAVRVIKLVILSMVLNLAVVTYVWYSGYQGRVKVVKASRVACERGKKDRLANATGWNIASDARWQSGDYVVSMRYKALANDLIARSTINCAKVFPKAELFP